LEPLPPKYPLIHILADSILVMLNAILDQILSTLSMAISDDSSILCQSILALLIVAMKALEFNSATID